MSSTGVRIRHFVREHQLFSGMASIPDAEVLATARTGRNGDPAKRP